MSCLLRKFVTDPGNHVTPRGKAVGPSDLPTICQAFLCEPQAITVKTIDRLQVITLGSRTDFLVQIIQHEWIIFR